MADKSYTINTSIMKDAYANLDKSFKLNIVDSRGTTHPYREKVYYTVRKGDTLSKISVNNHTTVSILCKLNNRKKNDTLRIGKKIRVS